MMTNQTSKIAIIGGGPAGLVSAIASARRGIHTTVLERDPHPADTSQFNPDRSYPIDITGHGLKALRYIEATDVFDEYMLSFRGIKVFNGLVTEEWKEQGWTGSRGDILRSLMTVVERDYGDCIDCRFNTQVEELNVETGEVSIKQDGQSDTLQFDFLIGADGGGSLVRRKMEQQLPCIITEYGEIPNYSTMLELDQNTGHLDPHYLHVFGGLPIVLVVGAISGRKADSLRWFCSVGSGHELSLNGVEDARALLKQHAPDVLKMVSDDSLASFVTRKTYHIGRMVSCSQLHGGRAVLLGDAGAPFPPIGQGINAATGLLPVMELFNVRMGNLNFTFSTTLAKPPSSGISKSKVKPAPMTPLSENIGKNVKKKRVKNTGQKVLNMNKLPKNKTGNARFVKTAYSTGKKSKPII